MTAAAADPAGMTGGHARPGGRPHGTRKRYVLGPDVTGTVGRGCRCEQCRAANRAAHHHRDRMIAYGRWQPFVDAEPVREHVEALRRAGIGRRRVAELAGLSDGVLRRLLHGTAGRSPSKRVRPQTAAAVIAIQPHPDLLADAVPVQAAGTQRRLQALVAIGWSQGQLAHRLARTRSNFGALLARSQVTVATARAVTRLYDELWDQPPAEDTPRARVIADAARQHARGRGWVPPLAWDDDTIDDPAAAPVDGWQRTRRPLTSAALAEEAAELIDGQGLTRVQAAERLRVSTAALGKAFTRTRRTPSPPTPQEGSAMPFDPVPRSAPEYVKGAAFAHQMFLRQHDAGVPADMIAARHTAAVATLTAAARSDGEREFLRGFTATGHDHLQTLRGARRAKADQLQWEQEQETEHSPEREAG